MKVLTMLTMARGKDIFDSQILITNFDLKEIEV